MKTNWTIIEIIFYYVLVYSYAFGNFKIILFIRSVYKSYTEEINFYDNIIECIYIVVYTRKLKTNLIKPFKENFRFFKGTFVDLVYSIYRWYNDS